MIPEIKFGRYDYYEDEGQGAFVHSVSGVSAAEYAEYIAELAEAGFLLREDYMLSQNSFATFEKDGDAVFCAYYPALSEMKVVTEEKSAYLSFKDTPCEEICSPLLTQIDLEDFGMSYVIRLSDGRFIVFDGGWDFEPDAEKLMKALIDQSPYAEPIIAAWIMTHPHIDHYRCFLKLYERYSERIVIERFIFNFPDLTEANREKVPPLFNSDEDVHIKRLFEIVKETKAPLYKAHTGQQFSIGGAELCVLASPDDTFVTPVRDTNWFSLVIKMEIAGQTILFAADSYFHKAKLGERWGEYLKSDILQVPHHAFAGGRIAEYNFINPEVCLVPGFEDDTLATICIYKDINKHLIYNLGVKDYFTGSQGNVTLPLPYTPRENGKELLFKKIDEYGKSLGAKSWFFDGVNSGACDFFFINAAATVATVKADLIFADFKYSVKSIVINIPAYSNSTVNIVDPNAVDGDALFFNRASLKKKGVPDGVSFTVHFTSDVPIIIKGKKEAIYFA